jgi:exopolyphosphatase/guanosine-5'-triphosphate,3'-diphosphate pyrophosphatase
MGKIARGEGRIVAARTSRTRRKTAPRTVGVIELGTTSIRMVVAEITDPRQFRIVDNLQRPVSLGKDAFTRQVITPEVTEQCVSVLRSFQRVLREHEVDAEHVRIVATSAVREAANREAFVDRLAIATGAQVDVLNEAEVSRLTYLAVRPLFEGDPDFKKTDTAVIEVGGGSTEALMFRRGRVFSSQMYRLGSLRLRSTLEDHGTPEAHVEEVLSGYVEETADRISNTMSPRSGRPLRLLALGSEARFACGQIHPQWDKMTPTTVDCADIEALTQDVLKLSIDDVVRRYGMSYPDAETLAPALLVYTRLARALGLDEILVGEANLRSGILADISTHGEWTADFKRQIIASATAVGRRYRINMDHARNVSSFSQEIFRAMHSEHQLGDRDGILLVVASLLHEVGYFVNNRSHHKHSFYLIVNSDIFGLGTRDLLLAALIARYHRGSPPKPGHKAFASLTRSERIVMSKLAAILRVANALDLEGAHRRHRCRAFVEDGALVIELEHDTALRLEQHRIRERAFLFEQVYGMPVELRPWRG